MKKGKWENNTFYCILLIVGLLALSHPGYGQRVPRSQKPLNVGFKVGLNAISSTGFDVYSEGELVNGSQTNKTGYNANAFFRINLDHFFMQPEFEWHLYKQDFSFSIPTGEDNAGSIPYDISQDLQTFNINILVGYSIIKNGPYVFNAYAGPSFKYNYYSKLDISDKVFRNTDAKYKSYGILGLSFSISKFFVDMRYEISIVNTDIDFSDYTNIPERLQNVCFKKNENILSFSCGMFF
ncbi:MAG: PorT family protein [Bacteroidales bacterium]|nr:PorT family protein [Bacteroidales bacterium]